MMTTNHLYIHVPFCKTICSYCDFCHRVYDAEVSKKWLDKIEEEFKEECVGEFYKTIYIGGGTPSSLNFFELKRLLEMVEPYRKNTEEYTMEINPETVDENKIKLLAQYGINRVSIGLQSTDENELKLLGRNHSFLDVKRVIEIFRKNGIDNISVDLMYSLPNQTLDSLKKTLDDVLSLKVPHISIYSLTIEENSVFGKKGYKSLDEEMEADMYEYIVYTLNKNGYKQYEIANFAKEGYESKHNMGYWNYDDYRGLSCGSTSKISHKRYDKTRNINSYLSGAKKYDEYNDLSIDDECFENIMMSLRTSSGLNLIEFKNRYNKDALVLYKRALEKNKDNFKIENNHLVCLNRNILNNILVDFLY